jgi:hypothetical protein
LAAKQLETMPTTKQPQELNGDAALELQKTKARLESEQSEIVQQIQAIRRTARDESLRAQLTREVLDPQEAVRRRERIAELQAALMKVQAKLGNVNRYSRPETKPIGSGSIRSCAKGAGRTAATASVHLVEPLS